MPGHCRAWLRAWSNPTATSGEGLDGALARERGLTVVGQPVDELGATAAELMLRVIAEGPDDVPPVSLPMTLVVRSSS